LRCPSKHDSIKLSDINVQVRGEEIVIWSVKHQKRLMPRLSSAYNFNRSSLALFRFLCDLQYQHLTTQLSFKLSDLIKGCKSYPRVYYKNVIISPAMWTVPNNFRNIASKDIRSKIPEFTEWVCTNNISRHFKFGIHDQTLVFDTHSESDIAFFLAIIKSHKTSLPLITETSSSASSVRDDQGKPLHSQLLLTYYHRDKIFEPLSFLPHAVEPVETTAYLPGSLWFYFEIYCHPIRSNDLLVHELSSLLNNVRPWVQKWFFVRYDYPSPHIRVRIKLKDKHSISKLIWRLEKTFKVALGNRMITDLQIKTYFPELQRYGRAGIDLTETIFYEDSEYVLKLLHADLPVQLLYEDNLKFMYASFVCQTQDIDNMIRLAERIAESFAVELNLTIDDFKKINNDFNQLIPIANMELPRSIHIDNYLAFLKIALESFDQRCDAEAFVVDLVHMHVNRLFQDHQRTHEAILYQFLTKYLKMMRARSKSLSE
jgi:thiopeptide-type bacteriocin biosynthesis protein